MDYTQYKAIDFIKDESFQSWCMHPNGLHAQFWEKWILDHPNHQDEVHQARQLLAELQKSDSDLSEGRIEQLWAAIQRGTQGRQKERTKVRRRPMRQWSRAAAIWIGLLMIVSLGIYWLANQSTTIMFATAYGEMKSVVLPDGSQVVINGNSTLRYSEAAFDSDTRAVQLEGEAYFSIKHTPDHRRFVVNTSDGMAVEVLGTRFTLTDRPMKKQVVLEEGRVSVSHADARGSADRQAVYMAPGELVAWDSLRGDWHKGRVEDPTMYGSFRENRLIFKKTPLHEVARVLADNYGYQVTFSDEVLSLKHFTGSCGGDEIPLLLRSISKAFGVAVDSDGQQIAITNTD